LFPPCVSLPSLLEVVKQYFCLHYLVRSQLVQTSYPLPQLSLNVERFIKKAFSPFSLHNQEEVSCLFAASPGRTSMGPRKVKPIEMQLGCTLEELYMVRQYFHRTCYEFVLVLCIVEELDAQANCFSLDSARQKHFSCICLTCLARVKFNLRQTKHVLSEGWQSQEWKVLLAHASLLLMCWNFGSWARFL